MSTIQSNYAGMTIIERLIVTGQFETFKRALKKNKISADQFWTLSPGETKKDN